MCWRRASSPSFEWERAARGSDNRAYPWGNSFSTGFANTKESGIGALVQDGIYSGGNSQVGTFDMSGNAAEWTADSYLAYPGNSIPDSQYGTGLYVVRGGSFNTSSDKARVSARDPRDPNQTYPDVGLRCVKDLPNQQTVVQIPNPRYTFYLSYKK